MKPYYSRAGITLYLGDCRDILPTLPHGRDGAELLLADPPYGVKAKATGHRSKPLALPGIANDRPKDAGVIAEGLALAWSVLKFFRHAYVFGPFDVASLRHAVSVTELVWDKELMSSGDLNLGWAKTHERVAFAMRADGPKNASGARGGVAARVRRGSVLRYPHVVGSGAKHHISEKPIPLLRELIEMSSRHGETVLDPFAGSGSTLVAALIEGRQAIGIELEEPWCEVAAKRLDALTAQGVLFGGAA